MMSEIRVRGAIYRGRTVESIARRVFGRRAEVRYSARIGSDAWVITIVKPVGHEYGNACRVLASGMGYGRTEMPELG